MQGVEFAASNKWFRFSVENVKILPLVSSAFFTETLTDSGLTIEKDGYKKLYGILDIGYRTTDFLIFEKEQFIGEKKRTFRRCRYADGREFKKAKTQYIVPGYF